MDGKLLLLHAVMFKDLKGVVFLIKFSAIQPDIRERKGDRSRLLPNLFVLGVLKYYCMCVREFICWGMYVSMFACVCVRY